MKPVRREEMDQDLEKSFRQYKKSIYKAARDQFIRTALRRAIKSFREARDEALEAFPEVAEKKKLLRERKEYAIAHLDELVGRTIDSIEKTKGKAYFAATPEDALLILGKIVGSDKLIVKAKSITSEELGLNAYLEETGNEVYETDLGEFIVQAMGGRPMHILAPAVNVPREKVAEVLSEIAGRDLPPDPVQLAGFVREFLRDKFFKADIGISGANALIAETGSIFLLENEGNIRLATGAPPVHIAIVGIEKILPTMADGTLLVDVISRYAGYLAMTYVSIISGPSKTGDIEKVVVYGAHGPKELHVILLDGGRSEAAKDPILREALYCVRCGACMYECPVYPITTGYWGYRYMGGIGVPWTALVSGGLEKAAPLAFTCTVCGRCVEHCPLEIDNTRIIQKIRELLKEKGLTPASIQQMARNVLDKGTPY